MPKTIMNTENSKNMSHKFWMVYNPNGKKPTVSHSTEKEAKAEAKRLATLAPGERFCVLESMYECVTAAPTIKTVEHRHAPQAACAESANDPSSPMRPNKRPE